MVFDELDPRGSGPLITYCVGTLALTVPVPDFGINNITAGSIVCHTHDMNLIVQDLGASFAIQAGRCTSACVGAEWKSRINYNLALNPAIRLSMYPADVSVNRPFYFYHKSPGHIIIDC